MQWIWFFALSSSIVCYSESSLNLKMNNFSTSRAEDLRSLPHPLISAFSIFSFFFLPSLDSKSFCHLSLDPTFLLFFFPSVWAQEDYFYLGYKVQLMLVHIWSCIDLTWKASFLSVMTDKKKNTLCTFINSLIIFLLYHRQNTCSLFPFLVFPWSKFGGIFKVRYLICDVVLAGTPDMLRIGEVVASCRRTFKKNTTSLFFSWKHNGPYPLSL